jgi:hypothetical protein
MLFVSGSPGQRRGGGKDFYERNLGRCSHSRGGGAVDFLGPCQVFRNQRSIEQSEEPRLFDPQPSHHHKAPIDALAMASRTREAGMQPPTNSRVAGSIAMQLTY